MNKTARIAVGLLVVLGLQVLGLPPAARGQTPSAPPPSGPLMVPGIAPSVVRLDQLPPDQVVGDPLSPVLMAEAAAAQGRELWSVSADYLLGFIRSTGLPPLLSTSPAGTSFASAGVLGSPGAKAVIGGTNVNGSLRSGFALGFGGWVDDARTIGADMGFFMLESQNALLSANSGGTPILARPFINALIGTFATSSQVVAFPGKFTGSLAASDRSNNLYGAYFDLKEIFLADSNYRLESLVGYRFLGFDDRLRVDQNTKALGGSGLVPGTQFMVNDTFDSRNQFHGMDLGLRGQFFGERWLVELVGKVALGDMHQRIDIGGSTVVSAPGQPTISSTGGFLALASNIGTYHPDQFTAVPEVGAIFGWRVTNGIIVRVGYTALFINDVARAGDQVNLALNPNLFPPPRAGSNLALLPAFQVVRSDMWVQTINLGLEFRY